ncbi:MAG TPA: Pycsar system effector family protein, partial [Brumimicrobium sp.]|nr:Pycsar system effector family protein [Brumimicrobium sp.]
EDFNEAMNDLMKDRDYLYDTLIKDLYSLGVVLNKKYKLLGISYTVFMIGIIVSVTAFSIAFMRI